MGKLTITSDDNKGIIVLRGKMSWIQQRAVAYKKRGDNVKIQWEKK